MAKPPEPPASRDSHLDLDEAVSGNPPKPSPVAAKVILDLDDAPFLDETPEDPHAIGDLRPPEPEVPDDKELSGKPLLRRAVIITGVLFALLAAGLILWLTRSPPSPESMEPTRAQETQPVPALAPEELTINMDPFWVAYPHDDNTVFLTLRLVLVLDGTPLYLEARHKTIVLRDAIYSYLNNRPLPQIRRAGAAEALKTDLMSVVNQHLSRPLNDILIGEYMVW